ncbi:MAG: thrombospondin type 3 repeat protein, partial [Myxococcota bacterium]
ASRQSSTGCRVCATGTSTAPSCNSSSCTAGCLQTDAVSNDVFGCGNFGDLPSAGPCSPIDRFSNNRCIGLSGSPWSCNDGGPGYCEAYVVTKSAASAGAPV